MRITSLILFLLTVSLAWGQGGLSTVPSMSSNQFLRVEAEILEMDIENSEIHFRAVKDSEEYFETFDEKTKFKAEKGLLDSKPTAKDFKAGDRVRVRVNTEKGRLVEVKLLSRSDPS